MVAVDDASRTIRTHERGGVLRRWDHSLRVEPLAEGAAGPRCRYHDTVVIDAGALTAVVAGLAVGIYRYRHRRWQRLVRKHLRPDGARPAQATGGDVDCEQSLRTA